MAKRDVKPGPKTDEELEAKRLLDRAAVDSSCGRREQALVDVERALALAPDVRDGWYLRAWLRDRVAGDTRGALADLDAGDACATSWSVRPDMERCEAHLHRACALLALRDWEAALAAADALIVTAGEGRKAAGSYVNDARRVRADAHAGAGHTELALAELDDLLKKAKTPRAVANLGSTGHGLFLRRARLRREVGRLSEAADDYRRLSDMTDTSLYDERARVLEEVGDVAGAIADLEQLVRLKTPLRFPGEPEQEASPERLALEERLRALRGRGG